MTAFETLLVANRGEIARRVIRSARALGLRTVAVYTDADAEAIHVREADRAVWIPSYLDVAAIVAAATHSADPFSTGLPGAAPSVAVHPGYGFLSERADLPRALAEAGVAFVGPTGEVMDAMGRKDRAREIASAAGVPVVPNWTADDALEAADFPVLVKAAAGGGGKGMRVVRSADELAEAQAAAAREAAKAFGDDTLLLEKYVERGRHIEVQVFGDTHGNVVHLFERDCSTQRRHQKVLEEAPAPTLSAEQRALVTRSAVALAQSVGYTGAGTVEFLLDDATGEAYFLEMNTRLQVEHPVTEEVIRVRGERIDLVELQLHIAAGETLGFAQSDVTVAGHAIEARVYAEDAWHGFLPQAGTASYVAWPGRDRPLGAPDLTFRRTRAGLSAGVGAGVRVDHALESGQVVSTSFDPMLGKVIAVGPDREQARRVLVTALGDTAIFGLITNVGFLRELAASDAFRDAAIDTAWLDRTEIHDPMVHEGAQVAAAWIEHRVAVESTPGPLAPDGWRDGGAPAPIKYGETWLTEVTERSARASGFTFREIERQQLTPEIHRVEFTLAAHHLEDRGVQSGGERQVAHVRLGSDEIEVVGNGHRFGFDRPGAHRDHIADASDGSVLAPMPGTVLDVRVREGDVVVAGQVLGVMEAMKMELTLTAPYDGTVAAVETETGAQVVLGARLFHVDGAESSA
ncbi:acetyl/propionyl/methylcrotonyl-CoA carboxylase subunit alpha [Nocardioides cavernaquae]|uniref:ATP-grasp domain-containing protein n=1 Tax=Nocardioides cavernaquae TaxID=2321396 RepID=A0A3A5H574_9ACTN|nr:biotin carboxylase N-terminal domain-containing protein [Nocardioides cavernaquae]RJS45856.1 ATP-grasp domain-containing protein [Nocardioides cavernaquae]